ncbi:MAG: ABC transporter substrate-binding protein [candidate division NC10 bacterium]|nr:ABC transporter substrate-binding protein [candidate division NC10 bacterium]
MAVFGAPLAAVGQQAGKIPRIGFLANNAPTHSPGVARIWDGIWQGLREHGWVEGHNIIIESRFSEGRFERFPGFAAELVRLNVDLIVASTAPAIRAAKEATTTIPIVMVGVDDPVGLGFVASLARPGGNITGVTHLPGEGFAAKRLQLLKETVPTASRVAALINPANPDHRPLSRELQVAAEALKLKLQILQAQTAEELESAFEAAARERASAVYVLTDPMFFRHRTRILELAATSWLPAMYFSRVHVEEGGLMSYGVDPVDHYRRIGAYIDKILKGANPATLPVEQPTKFELVINLRTAKALGLALPQSILIRADHVIQ